ncbi:hypothetical protein GUITHDRAFT_156184 [Guillardia theta CCMP2712]|uniref:Elongation factor P n=1 Tax=Guillardia theta (strain CCMP2712) TaxID=905079 RepID=L1I9R0_GUITC|nr:hypothetical protein GUITHDRAFT_156184 [Guillardia theta CCMP2712]EKX32991.1 hypothetical protein GUITHDRAFT_156184 [Guillardia theta CCMP2712]|eukprot:XP_005819971.1 hypothetical protein GUITHDRAFT_156184 [Guillardia theta CCMP2712]
MRPVNSSSSARSLQRSLSFNAGIPAASRLWTRSSPLPSAMGLRFVSVQAAELRKGEVFEFKGSKCTVIKLSNQINNRKAFVIVEFRDLKSKSKRTETFRAEEKLEKCFVEKKELTYLYSDNKQLYLQDPSTFEGIEVPESIIAEHQLAYLNEGDNVKLILVNEEPLLLELPAKALCEVERVDGKNAVLTNGRTIAVPSYVNVGTRVFVSTETEEFLGRD